VSTNYVESISGNKSEKRIEKNKMKKVTLLIYVEINKDEK
jgi:hypothetical protein